MSETVDTSSQMRRNIPIASASALVMLKNGASNMEGSCLRKYPP